MVFVSCVNLCFIQSHKIFSCVFFYKFHSFTFWSMIPSKLIFISGVRLGLRFSFACEYPLVVPFVQDYPFPHWITWHLCWTKASLVAQLVKNLPALQADPFLIPWSGRSAGEGLGYPLQYSWTSLVTQTVKNLPAMWKIWVWSLNWEDPLENILAWRIPWTEEPGRPQSIGSQSQTLLSDFHFLC